MEGSPVPSEDFGSGILCNGGPNPTIFCGSTFRARGDVVFRYFSPCGGTPAIDGGSRPVSLVRENLPVQNFSSPHSCGWFNGRSPHKCGKEGCSTKTPPDAGSDDARG
jgi:hypothetical protein